MDIRMIIPNKNEIIFLLHLKSHQKKRQNMQSNLRRTTPNKFVRSLTVVHIILILSLVGFSAVALLVNSNEMDFAFDSKDTLLLVFPVIAISALSMVRIIPQKMIDAAKKEQELLQKLAKYQSAMIIKFILIEGPAMIGIVFFFVTKNAAFLAISAVLIVFLFLQRPTKDRVVTDLELRGEHRNQFMKYDEMID